MNPISTTSPRRRPNAWKNRFSRTGSGLTLLSLGLSLIACGPEEPTPTPGITPTPEPTPYVLPESCDAGEEAFITHLMTLLWGRRPHGNAELSAWADMSRQYGREQVTRAMTYDPAFYHYWQDWMMDALGVARMGDRSFASCFSEPMLPEATDALALHIQQHGVETPFGQDFNMADVLRSSLILDDLSVIYRANLFSRMARPLQGANVGPYEMEDNRRTAFGDEFFQYYLNRNMTCLACHNSEFSATGSDDPAQDRTWEIPGHFEKALLGNSFGIQTDTAYQMFRYTDLMNKETATIHPWGIFPSCGIFTAENLLVDDFLEQEGYFIDPLGVNGSVYDVERYLKDGVESLSQTGLKVASDLSVEPTQAFAWLLAASIADQVWDEATGSRLTIANAFPRNQAQRDRLNRLTSALADSRFSLRTLLTNIVTDPYFNQGSPATCQARAYGLEAVFNPWSPSESEPEKRRNSVGDMAHRLKARALIHSVHDSLGWAQPNYFLASKDPLLTLELQLGAFMRTGQPGFNGTDFQGALAFESTYGACQPPQTGGAGDGCKETPGFGGCASCNCQSCACAIDPYCCDVQWDSICVSICNDTCGGCGGGLAGNGEDTVDRILNAAKEKGATVGDVVLALKDRLVARGQVTTEEQALMESLLQTPLNTPLSEAGELEPGLRVLCGAILISPDYFLALDPAKTSASPSLALDVDQDCQRVATLMAQVGVSVTCQGGKPQ